MDAETAEALSREFDRRRIAATDPAVAAAWREAGELLGYALTPRRFIAGGVRRARPEGEPDPDEGYGPPINLAAAERAGTWPYDQGAPVS